MNMHLKSTSKPWVGILGMGNFGCAMGGVLNRNSSVLAYTRHLERTKNRPDLPKNIRLTEDLHEVAQRCKTIFIFVPSTVLRTLTQELSPSLTSSHQLIHGIKGLDVTWPKHSTFQNCSLTRSEVKTMSEVILETTGVTQVGCLSGPTLASEMIMQQPAALILSTPTTSLWKTGIKLLKSPCLHVFSNSDLFSVELCGALKNIFAIIVGMARGLGYGHNVKSFIIHHALLEMIAIGKALGASPSPFLGLAGLGDLVATCSSEESRNFTVGFKIAQNIPLAEVLLTSNGVSEGVETLKTIYALLKSYPVRAPLTELLFRILFKNLLVKDAVQYLLRYPVPQNIDFIKEA